MSHLSNYFTNNDGHSIFGVFMSVYDYPQSIITVIVGTTQSYDLLAIAISHFSLPTNIMDCSNRSVQNLPTFSVTI